MKTEISRDSHQPEKRYSGVYQQQGRMLTDADWNELVDILKCRLDDALKDVVGNGSPLHRKVVDNESSPPRLRWGHLYVDGVHAELRGSGDWASPADFYLHQADFPSPPPLPVGNYILYADVWERTVTHLMDERLRDKGLHGADTCTRKQVMAQVKWCPDNIGLDQIDPENSPRNPRWGDYKATIKLMGESGQSDLAEKFNAESRAGNYLFRIEVHDVKGYADAPTEITLKWSSENGAIQCHFKDGDGNDMQPPEHFTTGDWAYEFLDETSEKHLGVHLCASQAPVRGILKNKLEKPTGAGEPNAYVRRWDGYCTLKKGANGSWGVSEQYDKNFKESSFASVTNDLLTIKLPAQQIAIGFGKAIVAGDYWLAEVREDGHESDRPLIGNAPPCGIEHRYLKLGKVENGALQAIPEADRKYAFPPLTELIRLYYVGGDGQQAMPGHALDCPLRVRVANGQRPVKGAKVRFRVIAGGGTLNGMVASALDVHSENDGMAFCIWKLGASGLQQVSATLLDANGQEVPASALLFNAGLSVANNVAYALPACTGNTVQSLLGTNLNALVDGKPDLTVSDVLQALLCLVKSEHIPHLPGGNETATNVQTALHGKVNKHGDTMSGALTISNALTVTGNANVGGSMTIAGDLIVEGDTTTVNVAEMQVEDNIIRVNKYLNQAEPQNRNGGMEVFRGGSPRNPNAQLIWDETLDVWKAGVDGNLYSIAYGQHWESLINNSVVDSKHRHSKLVAPGGSPDPALSVDNAGNVGITNKLQVTGTSQLNGNTTVSGYLYGAARGTDPNQAALRIATGHSDPKTTVWVQLDGNPNCIYADINTSSADFKVTPQYFTSMGGKLGHSTVMGATSIHEPQSTSFRVYLYSDTAISPTVAKNNGWFIQWVAIGHDTVTPIKPGWDFFDPNWKDNIRRSQFIDLNNFRLNLDVLVNTKIADFDNKIAPRLNGLDAAVNGTDGLVVRVNGVKGSIGLWDKVTKTGTGLEAQASDLKARTNSLREIANQGAVLAASKDTSLSVKLLDANFTASPQTITTLKSYTPALLASYAVDSKLVNR